VHAVRGQQDQNNEVGDQQRHIEGVGVVQPSECRIEKMLANVLTDTPRGHESG
jgi:hypothetical protein